MQAALLKKRSPIPEPGSAGSVAARSQAHAVLSSGGYDYASSPDTATLRRSRSGGRMKIPLAAMLIALAGHAGAGELFSGSHTYVGTGQDWFPVPGAGYTTLIMVGTYTPMSGPIPESRIECRGANFWTTEVSEASGICVFGELPDRWMLRYRMVDREVDPQRRERFIRRGEWTVVGRCRQIRGHDGVRHLSGGTREYGRP